MRATKTSKTADAVTALRAAHHLYDSSLIFDDPYALGLTSAGWRVIVGNRALYRLTANRLLGVLRPTYGQVLVRARYSEDRLEQAMAAGIGQYVNIGAGLDSFALRRTDLADRLRVFELDHPASQRVKRRRLARLGEPIPANLEFAAVDFEKETVAQALARGSFDRDVPAFFAWLGTVVYLTRDAVFATLESIASHAAPGSEIVFNYSNLAEFKGHQLAATTEMRRLAARRGEPLITYFEPEDLIGEVAARGYELIENAGAEALRKRYTAGREDGLDTRKGSYLAHFRVV